MAADLIKTLQSMNETQLTRQVVLPLLRSLFPNTTIEETHGTIEEGRDLICYGKHQLLNRNHVVCVQVKNHKLSYGATAGPYSISTLRSQVEHARRNGIVRQNGDSIQPDEVWVMSGHPFPAGNRKLSQTFIQDISMLSGKFIDGSELASLLRANCPDLVRELENIGDSRLAQTIAWLSQHHESKAFGLRLDRTLDDFCVKSRVFPAGAYSTELLTGSIDLKSQRISVTSSIEHKDAARFKSNGSGLLPTDLTGNDTLRVLGPLVKAFEIPVEWSARLDDEFLSGVLSRLESPVEDGEQPYIPPPIPVDREYLVDFDRWVTEKKTVLVEAMKSLPKRLDGNTYRRVHEIVGKVRDVERALCHIVPACVELDLAKHRRRDGEREFPSLQIVDEHVLLKVAPRILVQGAPGAGKTTFSRRLALSLLRRESKVILVSCSKIQPKMKGASLGELAGLCAAPDTPKAWNIGNAVVIVDGLDEAPFDLSETLIDAGEQTRCGLVATARASFPTRLRQEFATIEISGFTGDDRNAFFRRWFAADGRRLAVAEGLISANPDIALHTRLPLMATLVAALVENDYSPTTRAEIYAQRLELLLERWEAVKGLRRTTVPQKSQLRYLRRLAYAVHQRRERSARFGLEELRDAFASALGAFGDRVDPDAFIKSLVFVSGVLHSDGQEYSFGHLSFQEHLAGWYLSEHASASQLGNLLGDDWWAEVLKFYAGISEDITDLIEWCEEKGVTQMHLTQLRCLVSYAPHTASVAVQVLEAT